MFRWCTRLQIRVRVNEVKFSQLFPPCCETMLWNCSHGLGKFDAPYLESRLPSTSLVRSHSLIFHVRSLLIDSCHLLVLMLLKYFSVGCLSFLYYFLIFLVFVGATEICRSPMYTDDREQHNIDLIATTVCRVV